MQSNSAFDDKNEKNNSLFIKGEYIRRSSVNCLEKVADIFVVYTKILAFKLLINKKLGIPPSNDLTLFLNYKDNFRFNFSNFESSSSSQLLISNIYMRETGPLLAYDYLF